jgi:integrase
VKPPKIVKTFRLFDTSQVSQLIEEAEEPLKIAIVILVNPGMRRAELHNLRWRDVDLEIRKLRVWPLCRLYA